MSKPPENLIAWVYPWFNKQKLLIPTLVLAILLSWSEALLTAGRGKKPASSASSHPAVYSVTDITSGEVTKRVTKRRRSNSSSKRPSNIVSVDYNTEETERLDILDEFAELKARGEFNQQPVKQAGISSFDEDPEGIRDPRSYNDDEILQIQKHISSQLFAAVRDEAREHRKALTPEERKNDSSTPTEIEMMVDDKQNIFISANKNSTLDIVHKLVVKQKGFDEILTTSYATKNSFIGKKSRSDAAKYAGLAKGEDRRERKLDAAEIHDIVSSANELHHINLELLETTGDQTVLNQIRGEKGGRIYLVYGKTDDKGRHAEEKLMDLVKHVGDTQTHYTVAGKKRPCMSCYGRMLYCSRKEKFNISHGHNPGRLWEGRWKAQPFEIFKYTFTEVIKKARTHLSRYIDENGNEKLTTTDATQSKSEESANSVSDERVNKRRRTRRKK
ncbi:hypothetical protein Pan241w_14830 [Gimesia alba]|uniref:Uncharacterized protein n=1 Tax=Gimesia alba TaxID=2527973 RepID=A0A517RC18_9PLAN|nr:hypothetical protein [Gimesia alba]QDT41422.1 hypothetical protein Pan241w_14830 [Gimesia alba]